MSRIKPNPLRTEQRLSACGIEIRSRTEQELGRVITKLDPVYHGIAAPARQ